MKMKFNIQSGTNLIAGLIIGGMIMAASILPAGASADSPSVPLADESSSVVANAKFNEVDDWVSLTYQPKLALSNVVGPEVDNWVSLTYQEKLVRSSAKPFEVDDWVSLA